MSTEDMASRDWMRLHVETMFTLDRTGRLVSANEPDGATAPRFFLGRTMDGKQWWFRHDMEDTLVEALDSMCLKEPSPPSIAHLPWEPAPFEPLLSAYAPIQTRSAGPAYRFPEDLSTTTETVPVTEENADLLLPHFEDWLADVPECQPFVALLENGGAVSLCATVRTTGRADEAGVDTHPDFRGRGFAGQVVAGWANAVRGVGRIPLYSTSWENTASQSVAHKLGLIQFGADLHIT